jgi:hypothetical protein
VALTADTKEQLDSDTETLFTIGRKHLCQFATLKTPADGRPEHRPALRREENRSPGGR